MLALGLASPALAQNQPRGLNNDPDAADVALTPLGDLNLRNDPIPPLLLAAREAPYDQTGVRNCRQLIQSVAELDAVLGSDFDTEVPDAGGRNISAGNIAQRLLGSLIPFRGIIREVSGANEHERDFREAIAAGMTRRAYLKGRGQGMGCNYPARPATEAEAIRIRAEREAAAAAAEQAEDNNSGRNRRGDDRRENAGEDSGDVQFVSEPVVQETSRRRR
ncbi:hypothetical protein [Alteraurantiacibacter buctensis]|uniref:hypothetical protein n=1 Tax=Alteraurantiacibacter buctensis TaxID=1503981 RepID=UPI0019271D04|nr:hypothetical protein [Alteraurantiacibacter buctensis]